MSQRQFVFIDTVTLHQNKKHNTVSPVIVVTGGGNNEHPRVGCRVKINGPCEIIYDKNGVISPGHGSVVTVVTEAEVEIEQAYRPVDR